jgi:hypothetical protein
MRSPDTESQTGEEIDDLAVRAVRAIRAERAGASWDVRSVAGYLDCSLRHVRRLIAVGELEGGRPAGSRAWAVSVRSMLAFEDRRYAARVGLAGVRPSAKASLRSEDVYGRGEGARQERARTCVTRSTR